MLDQLRRSDQPPRPLLQCGQPNTHREHGRKHNIQSGILYKESAQRKKDKRANLVPFANDGPIFRT